MRLVLLLPAEPLLQSDNRVGYSVSPVFVVLCRLVCVCLARMWLEVVVGATRCNAHTTSTNTS